MITGLLAVSRSGPEIARGISSKLRGSIRRDFAAVGERPACRSPFHRRMDRPFEKSEAEAQGGLPLLYLASGAARGVAGRWLLAHGVG